MCDNVQRTPAVFVSVLQKFQQRLREWIHQQPGFLKRIQAEIQYSAFPGPLQEDFRQDVAKLLAQEWQALSGELLSQERLEEIRSDGFWEEYVCSWLLAQPPVTVSVRKENTRTIQGKSYTYSQGKMSTLVANCFNSAQGN